MPADELPHGDDETAESNAKKREARRRREDEQVMRDCLASAQGRAWFYRRLDECNMFGDPFVQGSPDGTAYMLGRQSIGKMLWLEAEGAAADLVLLMKREHEAELMDIVEELKRRDREFEREPGERALHDDDQYPQLPKPVAPAESKKTGG